MNEGMNPLRIVVIGCGNRGHGHMRIVHNFEDVDLVATPPHLNAEVAQVCLENRSDTLVEKPPGFMVKETEQLRGAAARTGAKAMVG